MTNYEELARAAITAELVKQVSDDPADEEAYVATMAECCKHPMVILHLAHYAATALATAVGGFPRALETWQRIAPALAAGTCSHGYAWADCGDCEDER